MKMSHLDGESFRGVPLAVGATWAVRATGTRTTNERARTQLMDFNTRKCIQLTSAICLIYLLKESAYEQEFQFTPIPSKRCKKLHTIRRLTKSARGDSSNAVLS
jgi:hypothetical protein